ncbi:MAG: Gfo/Idh/MocA family oxidoreductase, partial [Okeania sp. SIO1H5]|uniref:Gfo/Idh/MocA family protein n=1 Tax=Okeania sp. SIO1H5 TaxID=2607777 RepID=UPI0013B715F8
MKKVKIGMVGSGFAARLHAEHYGKLPGVDTEVIAIASKDGEEAKKFKKDFAFDAAQILDDAEKMIRDSDADIIDLTVPTFLHVPLSILAAEAGKAVICEKPLTGYFGDANIPIEERAPAGSADKKMMLQECLRDCQRLESTLKKHNSLFCYAENWVYAPPITKAKELIQSA